MIPSFQFLILDFNRPTESSILLHSLKNLVKTTRHDFWVTYCSNGGVQEYVLDFYKSGLINQLIIRDTNLGGGWGMRDLASLCQSEYCFLLQNDQFLVQEINDFTIQYFIESLKIYRCVDLAGNQCDYKYSDRAQFVKTKDYLSWMDGAPMRGPGPNQDGMHNEEWIQNIFKTNNYKISHISSLFFDNQGKWSIREHPDGGITKHSTDEKKLHILKPLRNKVESLGICDGDWELILSGKWKDGDIPQNWKKDSFLAWR